MSQSEWLGAILIAGFIVYLAMSQRLAVYWSILTGGAAQAPTPAPTAQPGAGNIVNTPAFQLGIDPNSSLGRVLGIPGGTPQPGAGNIINYPPYFQFGIDPNSALGRALGLPSTTPTPSTSPTGSQ